MKRFSISLATAALLALAATAWAQAPGAPPDSAAAHPDSAAAPMTTPATPAPAAAAVPPPTPPPAAAPEQPLPIYYGGTIGFSFWSGFFRISLEPLAAYKLTPKLSLGGKVRYEYINDTRGVQDYSSHNFGGSVFSNFRVTKRFYAHGEYAYMSYDYPSGRESVPFLLLGGGVSQLLRPNVWLNVEALWDVLNDPNSPYEDWQPTVSVGVGVGF